MDDREKQVLFLERLRDTAAKAAENGNMIAEEELKDFLLIWSLATPRWRRSGSF